MNNIEEIIFKLYFIGYLLDFFSLQFFYFNRISLFYKIYLIFAIILPFKYLRLKSNKRILIFCFFILSVFVMNSTFSGIFLNEKKIYKTNPYINEGKIEWREYFYEIQE